MSGTGKVQTGLQTGLQTFGLTVHVSIILKSFKNINIYGSFFVKFAGRASTESTCIIHKVLFDTLLMRFWSGIGTVDFIS